MLAADIATLATRVPVAGPARATVGAVQRQGWEARRHAGPLPRPVPLPTRLPYARQDRLAAYRDVGAWVDVFDYAPAFQDPGEPAEVTPETVSAMAGAGVGTIYIQAARDDPRSPGDLADPQLFGAFIERAHAHRMRVVAWYLPTLVNVERDLRRLVAMGRFRAGGEGVDGLAVDIEWVRGVPNAAERNRRVVALSRRLRAAVGREPLGAIVLPPVDTDVLNPRLWPAFPWRELGDVYDVWLPMSYWTNRSGGWRDAGRYTGENIRRLKAHLGAGTPVHAIGGIGDLATAGDYRTFVRTARRWEAIGVSIYDWDAAQAVAWELLGAGVRDAGQ